MAFQSFASERFWQLYEDLPAEVQRLADKHTNYSGKILFIHHFN
jgi:hypothetical protein